MNLLDSDDEDDMAKYSFYEKEDLKTNQPYEEYFDKLNMFSNQYIDKLNEFQMKTETLRAVPSVSTFLTHQNTHEKNIGVFDIIKTDNKIFNKIACVFAVIDDEINKIVEQFDSKLFHQLVVYGETPFDSNTSSDILKDGEAEIQTGRIMGVYKQIYDLVKRLTSLVFNLVNQLHAIYNKSDTLYKTVFKTVNLYSPLDSLGKALNVIFTLDCLIKENENLRNHWNFYKRMLKIVRSEPNKYNTTEEKIKAFEKILVKVDKTVLTGNCFKICLGQNFNVKSITITLSNLKEKTTYMIKDNKELMGLFQNYIRVTMANLNETIGSTTETTERKKLMNLLCTYALFRRLFPQEEDRKLWKTLWSFQKRTPVLLMHSHVIVLYGQFMLEIVPLSKKTSNIDPKDYKEYIRKYLSKANETFEKDIHNLYVHFTTWVVRMESSICSNLAFLNEKVLSNSQLVHERLMYRTKLIINGILLANQIRNLLLSSLLLHLNQRIELSKSLIKSFLHAIELLKAISLIIELKEKAFNLPILTRMISKQILDLFNPNLDKLKKAAASSKNEKADAFSSLQLILQVLKGPVSPLRLSILNFCGNYALTKGVLRENETEDLRYLLWKYEVIANYRTYVNEATDCIFLYWSKDLIPIFFQFITQNPGEAKRMQFLLSALNDGIIQMKKAVHLNNNEELVRSFRKQVLMDFHREYIVPLTREIEDFLRITIHSILIDKIKGINPLKTDIKALNKLLGVNKVQIGDIVIDLKDEIARILNETFYNINVLNMHDYQTYEEIRTLAMEKFGLDMTHVFIPSQTLNQGTLDILNIIRNIQNFVTKYTFNLYNQTFIELSRENKQLNTIGIEQIADSIHTHGLGIVNTNVNSVYKFILKKFAVFSQFLFDELIQSPLIREERFIKENKEKINGKYPFERAEALIKEVKRLGLFDDGKNFLDKFRVLITSVGNALGFVRLIKSAGLNYCSKNIEFFPAIDTETSFSEIAQTARFSGTTEAAGRDLDEIFFIFRENFSDKTDYLKILVKAFEGIDLTNESNKHLNYFYLILPSLTLNYIEHFLISKEKLMKKNSQDAFISDDGFALGCAYFMKLLNLNSAYDSLHWREEVTQKFEKEILDITKEVKKENISKRQFEEINMQKDLSMRKLTNQKEEFEMFFYTFQAARILFRES